MAGIGDELPDPHLAVLPGAQRRCDVVEHPVARSADLAEVLATADPALPEVLRGFATQPGVPRIALAIKCTPGATPQLRVAQARWQPLGLARADTAAAPAPAWRIPMLLRTPQARYRLMLDSAEATLTLPEPGCPAWACTQAGQPASGKVSVASALSSISR